MTAVVDSLSSLAATAIVTLARTLRLPCAVELRAEAAASGVGDFRPELR
jgi:hypothetical protein